MTGEPEYEGATRNTGRRPRDRAPLVLVLILAAIGAWAGVSSIQRSKTSVSWAGPVQCSGSRAAQQGRQLAGPHPVMRLHANMRCRLPVRVENHGWIPVNVTGIRLPLMGPEADAAVQVAQFEGRLPRTDLDDQVDAVFALHRHLPAGAAYEFDIEFTFRPEGCTALGVMTIPDLPQLTVQALGQSGSRSSSETIGFEGTPESECST